MENLTSAAEWVRRSRWSLTDDEKAGRCADTLRAS
jgi:hypothetical protein